MPFKRALNLVVPGRTTFFAKMMKDLLLSGKKIQEIYSEFSVVTFSSKLDDQVEEAATTRRTP